MADKIRTVNFYAAEIDGVLFELRQGRLKVQRTGTGQMGWRATAEFRGISRDLNRIAGKGAVRVEFETVRDGRPAGRAFLEVALAASGGALTWVQLKGLGDLEGWAA